jgi:uroporphyrinogen-III synthase
VKANMYTAFKAKLSGQLRNLGLLMHAEQLPHAWVVTSSAVLNTMLTWAQQLDLENAVVKMQQQRLYVPHVRIAEIAKELGFTSITLTASGDEKLLLALQSHP